MSGIKKQNVWTPKKLFMHLHFIQRRSQNRSKKIMKKINYQEQEPVLQD